MGDIWKAPTEEIDVLTHAISVGIRARLFGAREVGQSVLSPEGWVDVTLGEETVRVEAKLTPQATVERNKRPVQLYSASGHAAYRLSGYRFEAQCAIDLATRAMITCDIRHDPLGPLHSPR